VYRAGAGGLRCVKRRAATPAEEGALDLAAAATAAELGRLGLETAIVSDRLNRRKIDLIPVPEWADPPKARIAELLAAVESRLAAAGLSGLEDAVTMALAAAREAGLDDARVTSDAKHLELGLTDKADAARWALADLWRRGIAPAQVLLAGDEFGPLGGLPGSDSLLLVPEARGAVAVSVGAEPTGVPPGVIELGGGPDAFLALLRDQVARRRRGEPPVAAGDPAWTLSLTGVDEQLERVHESLLTLADGRLGTRGAPLRRAEAASPGVVFAGLYEGDGPETALAECAEWARLPGEARRAQLVRALDLRTGLLSEDDGELSSSRFASLARPGTVALRALAPAALLPASRREVLHRGAATALRDRRTGSRYERLAAYARDPGAAQAALAAAEADGFERLLVEHRKRWARRWEEADVVVEGDDELQRAIRLTLFHLIASVGGRGEAAVGARGLTGSAYSGHVFWDSDVFVLPFFAATHPAAARAMLEYRIRRLPAAKEAARRLGHAGARFPWESARTGVDVTPTAARLPTGEVVAIRTGEREEHIVADVAWAASCYLDWTDDEAFAAGPARTLLAETARYWASRSHYERDGRCHIRRVIGPDEYHELVDDNAFTNVMARWNLRRAAALDGASEEERRTWLATAAALADGYDPATGLYEQFAGFHQLEPLVIAELAPRRPVAAELLLGAGRTAGAQVLKQADVLMLHHLVPDEVAPGSLLPNLDFYEPRTAHGSSLSPAIHAALLARAGRLDAALAWLRVAARLDLDDLTGTTAGGLHLATMGGVWQALAFGFAGVRPRGGGLSVEPRLPSAWTALELGLRFRGRRFRLRIRHEGLTVTGDRVDLHEHDDHWEVVPR
jgi:trehalose/maltose hydrolase-like predicted phosphorylase